jgi:hypothetical protein
MRPSSHHRLPQARPARMAAILLTAAALLALAALPSAHAAPSAGPSARAAAAGKCAAYIRNKKGKYVPLKTTTYKYKYKKVGGGKFRRVIARVSVNVQVSCAKRCVLNVRKRGKLRPVFTMRKVKVKAKHGSRIVTVKRRRKVYRYGKCPKGAITEGTPVKIQVLDGSAATLDFGAFQRVAPVSGTFKGFVPGKLTIGTDIQVNLTGGSLQLGQTSVFIDDECNGQVSPAIRTGRPTLISLDATKQSTSTLLKSGTATATAYTLIRLPLELRNGEVGCNKPYITTGYREFQQTFFLRGKVDAGGLTHLVLTSAPTPIDVEACLAPGAPTQPCNGFAIPLPIIVSTKLVVAIDLGVK